MYGRNAISLISHCMKIDDVVHARTWSLSSSYPATRVAVDHLDVMISQLGFRSSGGKCQEIRRCREKALVDRGEINNIELFSVVQATSGALRIARDTYDA